MSDKATSKNVIKIDDVEAFELNDEQLDGISGGGLVPNTDRYICDKCGVETEFLGVNHQNVSMYQCPKCGQHYGIW